MNALATAAELAELEVGDAVLVTRSGRVFGLHVMAVEPPGSQGRAESTGPRVTVGYGPGRWAFSFDLEAIRGGFVQIERA